MCQTASTGGEIGCACCPPFDDCKPTGAPPLPAEPAYTPNVTLFGGFSAKGATEALMGSHFDCETNLSAYGHAVIARRAGARWKLVDHFVTSLQYATSYRLPDGRDLPIVLDVVGKTPSYTLASWDFRRPDGSRPFTRTNLLEWTTDAYAGCLGVEPGRTVSDMRLLSVAHVDRNGDAKADLVLELLERKGVPNEAYQSACAAMFEGDGVPGVDPASALSSTRSEWVLEFDGVGFRAPR